MIFNYKKEMTDYKYAVLQETNGKEFESWLYFIRHDGNEEALAHLQKELTKVDWYILDDLSTFDLELENLVSERTAKEMTKIVLNHVQPHRKFDGKLKMVDFGFRSKDSNDKRIVRVFKKLGIGMISDFVEEEDLPTDEEYESGSSGDESGSSGTEYEYDISDDSSEEEASSSKDGKRDEKRKKDEKRRKEEEKPIKMPSAKGPSKEMLERIKADAKAKKDRRH